MAASRLTLGGPTCVLCSLATILAGLLAGLVYRSNKGRLLGIIPAIVFGAGIEVLHGVLALLIVQLFTEAVEVVRTSIPPMIIAISLGVGIDVITFHDIIKVEGPGARE